MKATLILADAASGHPDGTFSLLRGGITKLKVPRNRPVKFQGALVARIVGTRGESGEHDFKLVCVNEDGGEIAPPISGKFEIPPQGGSARIVLNLQMTFPQLGPYEFSITVDKHQLDVWELEAQEAPAESAEDPKEV